MIVIVVAFKRDIKMKVKELIRQLKMCDSEGEMVFYYLKNSELVGCEKETILDIRSNPFNSGSRCELTIKEEGSNEEGDMIK